MSTSTKNQFRAMIAAALEAHHSDPAAAYASLEESQQRALSVLHCIDEHVFESVHNELREDQVARIHREGWPAEAALPALDPWLLASAIMAESPEGMTRNQFARHVERWKRKGEAQIAEAAALKKLGRELESSPPDAA